MHSKRGRKFVIPDIINIEGKFKVMGFDLEYATRKEDLIIYLIYFLGCMSLEQICVLFNVLETSVKTSIAKILKKYGNIIEVKKDEVNNVFYIPTRKTLKVLNRFCEVKENRNYKNIKHLTKINDFYINLFKSNCEGINIEYEKNLNNEVLEGCIVRADAVINVENEGLQYEFILEQDNKTEKITRLYDKIENYYNTIIHEKFNQEKVRYYLFRFDVFLSENHLSKYEKTLHKLKKYKELSEKVSVIQSFYCDVKNNKIPEGYFESRANDSNVEYSNKYSVLMKNISTSKSELLKSLDKLKRTVKMELSSMILRDRIEKVRDIMLKEFKVKSFDVDSEETIFNNITHQKRFGTIYSVMEAEDLLLRTNILCGNIKTDYVLKNILFGTSFSKEHLLKTIIKEGLGNYGITPESLKVKQLFKKIGYHTLCFSNYCSTHLNKKNLDVDCVLLMPTISVSDHCRIYYLLNLDVKEVNDSLVNTTFFFIITTDKQTELLYKEKIKKINSISKARFHIYPIDVNVIDCDLTPLEI